MTLPRGSVGRIGFLCPVDGLNDDEYWSYLADGVGWYVARYSAGAAEETLCDDSVAAYADPIHVRRAADLLLAIRPQAVALGDVAASVFGGPAGDRAMRDAVSGVVGVPVASGLTALTTAIGVIGARRVAVITPYPSELGARLAACLENAGLTVLSLDNADETDEFGIALSPATRWVERAAAADRPDAEAVVVAGGGVRIGACLEALESAIGKPVIASPAALVWLAHRLAGLDATRDGLGTLFSRHGRAALPV